MIDKEKPLVDQHTIIDAAQIIDVPEELKPNVIINISKKKKPITPEQGIRPPEFSFTESDPSLRAQEFDIIDIQKFHEQDVAEKERTRARIAERGAELKARAAARAVQGQEQTTTVQPKEEIDGFKKTGIGSFIKNLFRNRK